MYKNILTVNFVGAGCLGQTIAKLFVTQKTATIGCILNQSIESAQSAVQFIGQGVPCQSVRDLQPADVTFITVPDDQIAGISEHLFASNSLRQNSVLAHCSGVLSTAVFEKTNSKHHCHVGSVHPMKSFADPKLSVSQFSGTYCAIEGDDIALTVLQTLFQSIGAIPFQINAKNKAVYHAAGVFASNYLVTLYQQALTCLCQAGVAVDIAQKVVCDLMQSTITNLIEKKSAKKALTGPIKRGDLETIGLHIESLDEKKLYSELGLATLGLTDLPADKLAQIKKILMS